MDNGLLFPYRFHGGKGGTREDRLSIPIGHGVFFISGDAGAGKSTPDVKLKMGGSQEETRGDLVNAQAVKKSLVACEIGAPVPQTDSGRLV